MEHVFFPQRDSPQLGKCLTCRTKHSVRNRKFSPRCLILLSPAESSTYCTRKPWRTTPSSHGPLFVAVALEQRLNGSLRPKVMKRITLSFSLPTLPVREIQLIAACDRSCCGHRILHALQRKRKHVFTQNRHVILIVIHI